MNGNSAVVTGAHVVLSGSEQSALDESVTWIVASGGHAEIVVRPNKDFAL